MTNEEKMNYETEREEKHINNGLYISNKMSFESKLIRTICRILLYFGSEQNFQCLVDVMLPLHTLATY
jgi:hypothetical protein